LFTSFRYPWTEQDEGALARRGKPRAKTIPVNRPEHLKKGFYVFLELGFEKRQGGLV